MVWYEIRSGNRPVSHGFESRFYSKRRALEIARDFERRNNTMVKVVRVSHTETEVSDDA